LNPPLHAQAKGPATRNSSEQSPTVTVIICSRNRPALLRNCLASTAQLNPAPDQILVVDNSEGNEETRKAAHDYGARYVIEQIPGLSRARNRGLAECTTDIVAYLDDDATPSPNWLGTLLTPFRDQHVAATTGRVVTPQSSADVPSAQRIVSDKDPHWFEISTFGGMGLGSNMAIRRKACGTTPLFDERLGRGAPFQIAEENYAFARLISSGYTAEYLPDAVVFHPSLTRDSIEHEARNSICYWLLLFREFPKQRFTLLRFIFRRLLRKPLEWTREPQEPGEIVTSGWRVLLKAAFQALWLFLRTPRRPAAKRTP
jgi:glycosyltransferase involved in cell wall biosynthesis